LELLVREARDIAISIKLSAGYLGALWGSLAAVVVNAKQRGKMDPLLRICISASKLMADREVLFAYCSYIEAHKTSPNADRWHRYEKRRTSSRELRSAVPKGTPTTIKKILAGECNEDKFYRITGVVAQLRIEDDPAPPKYSSFFDLLSLKNEDHVAVRAHMFSLENNGLQDGKLCEIVGRIRPRTRWSSDNPEVDIDRINLGTLRKTYWIDDVVFRMRKYSKRYRDEMNMAFSPILPV
jgi:hypothetical protein